MAADFSAFFLLPPSFFPRSFSFIRCFLKLTGFWYKHVSLKRPTTPRVDYYWPVRISSFPNEIGHGKVSLRNWPELKTWKLPIFSMSSVSTIFPLDKPPIHVYIYIYIYTIGIKCQSHWKRISLNFSSMESPVSIVYSLSPARIKRHEICSKECSINNSLFDLSY